MSTVFGARDRLLRDACRARFVVTLLDGTMFSALLVDVDPRVAVFASARLLDDDGGEHSVEGELYTERSRVAYMQRVSTVDGA